MVAKLEPVDDLKTVWKHEARDFTKWLYDNCDVLGDQIGLTINPIEAEKAIGSFNVDILAEDESGKLIVIENQLKKTNHDHLGKVLTYLSNIDAKIAIWISPEPRPEHIRAIEFLNGMSSGDTAFYLVKVQAFRISGSEPAPLFSKVAGPYEEQTATRKMKDELNEFEKTRYKFFEQLLEKINEKTSIYSNISPVGYQGWISASAGKSGVHWACLIGKSNARVELVFDHSDKDVNDERYKRLLAHRENIEKAFGEPLEWDFKETRKQNYIRKKYENGGLDNKKQWGKIQDQMVDWLVRMDKALSRYIKEM